jgi:hypothetical protein
MLPLAVVDGATRRSRRNAGIEPRGRRADSLHVAAQVRPAGICHVCRETTPPASTQDDLR